MYCKRCGNAVQDEASICPNCGQNLKDEPTAQEVLGQYQPTANDNPSGYGALGFFIPLAGIILYFVWKQDRPRRAKACGKGALVSIILYAVIMIIYFIAIAVLMAH